MRTMATISSHKHTMSLHRKETNLEKYEPPIKSNFLKYTAELHALARQKFSKQSSVHPCKLIPVGLKPAVNDGVAKEKRAQKRLLTQTFDKRMQDQISAWVKKHFVAKGKAEGIVLVLFVKECKNKLRIASGKYNIAFGQVGLTKSQIQDDRIDVLAKIYKKQNPTNSKKGLSRMAYHTHSHTMMDSNLCKGLIQSPLQSHCQSTIKQSMPISPSSSVNQTVEFPQIQNYVQSRRHSRASLNALISEQLPNVKSTFNAVINATATEMSEEEDDLMRTGTLPGEKHQSQISQPDAPWKLRNPQEDHNATGKNEDTSNREEQIEPKETDPMPLTDAAKPEHKEDKIQVGGLEEYKSSGDLAEEILRRKLQCKKKKDFKESHHAEDGYTTLRDDRENYTGIAMIYKKRRANSEKSKVTKELIFIAEKRPAEIEEEKDSAVFQ